MSRSNRVSKSELQEWVQGEVARTYTVVDQQGPAHAPEFTIELKISTEDPILATGTSKQAAEQAAAAEMLARVQKKW